MKISCFFPMYNEEGNVESVVRQAVMVLEKRAEEFEVIIINDGSTDRTRELAEKMAKTDKRIKLVSHPKNLGYGAALNSGFSASRFEVIFQADGDNQFDLSELDRLLPFIEEFDFVIGFRERRQDPLYRIWEGNLYRFLLGIMFGLRLKDANCAFKLFKKLIMDKIKSSTSGALINGEIFIKARALGFSKIKEVGVTHYPRKTGKQTGAKPGVLWNALISILYLWRRYR
ncbi:glycosyltransferase family 2 protein [Candidatus Saganbacteria bacterium]|nr:glycosyltransferase family 2 protein [Candidatus Saganbacteria bacterium]